MTKISPPSSKTLNIKSAGRSKHIAVITAAVLVFSFVQISIPVKPVFATDCPPSANCHAWTQFVNDPTAHKARAAKVTMKTFSISVATNCGANCPTGNWALNHMWVDMGAQPQTTWAEIGYIRIGPYEISIKGDCAVYVDMVQVANCLDAPFTPSIGSWYAYEIEDKDNNGVWKMFFGTSLKEAYNFGIYNGRPKAGIETANTNDSRISAEAHMNPLQVIAIAGNYNNWSTGETLPHLPYYITECTEYNVKIKKNTVPTC